MKFHHNLDESFALIFAQKHAEICARLAVVCAQNPEDERFPRLISFFKKTATATSRHRYRTVEWKEKLAEIQPLYSDRPEVVAVLAALADLLGEVLRETKSKN